MIATDLDDPQNETEDFLTDRLSGLGVPEMPIRSELIRAVVEAGFRALDAGSTFEDVCHWAEVAVGALLDERPHLAA